MSVQITFLNHSGFAVDGTDSRCWSLITTRIHRGRSRLTARSAGSRCGSLSAIGTEDHFNRGIGQFGGAQYIVNEDVRLKDIPADRFHAMKLYETLPWEIRR